MKLSNKTLKTIERLEQLYEEEHGGCDSNTCGMQVAFKTGSQYS